MRRALLFVACLLSGCASFAQPGPGSVAFALIGDMPYNAFEIPAVDRLVDEMNGEDLAFVIHVGDITSGAGPCTDAWFEARKRQLERSRHPLVIVPGDNEWVDCHRSGRWDPLERLAKLRELFTAGDESLGARTIRLERQSADPRYAEYREHVRWVAADVLFVGLNVQGSNNNLGRTRAMDREYEKRMAAVLDWLDEAVKMVEERNLRGLVVFAQGDPDFELKEQRPRGVPDGFERFRNALRTHALRLKKPVLFVHGDHHLYINDRPLRGVPNFTRIQVYGSPLVRWIKAWIDPSAPGLFRVAPAPSPVPSN